MGTRVMLVRYVTGVVIISFIIGKSGLALGQEPRGYAYDPVTGTELRWRTDQDGTRHIVERNRTTKRIASSKVDVHGNESGIDADGTYWSYNGTTGAYVNRQKQTFCIVKPLDATCDQSSDRPQRNDAVSDISGAEP